MAKATLNKNGIATEYGDITVYEYDGEMSEFLAVDVGIQANSCTDAPLDAKGDFAVCRTTSLDGGICHRQSWIDGYNTKTGEPIEITMLGGLSR